MQNRTKLLFAAGAVAMLGLGGLAGLAQADMDGGMGGGHCGMGRGGPPGMMGRQLMERYDANKDGVVTQAEIDQNRQQWLAEFDTNKDGNLSLDEFKMLWLKSRNEMMVREFQFFDRDGNGQVTIEEYKGPMADIVANRDTNNDGSLGADDRPKADGPGWGQGWGHGWRQGRGMMRHGMMGGANCMDGGGAPGQPGNAPDAAPGDGPADEPANP